MDEIDCVATSGEGLFGRGCGFEGYASGRSLPGGRWAGGVGHGIFHFSVDDFLAFEEFLQNRFAAGELRDDGGDFYGIGGGAAVPGGVAGPTRTWGGGIQLGEGDWRKVCR